MAFALLPGARWWFCAISIPKLLAGPHCFLCAAPDLSVPGHGFFHQHRRLPTILARLGSEPLILEISKQNKGMLALQGAPHLARVLTSFAPVALLQFPGRITRFMGWLVLSWPKWLVAWLLEQRVWDEDIDPWASGFNLAWPTLIGCSLTNSHTLFTLWASSFRTVVLKVMSVSESCKEFG